MFYVTVTCYIRKYSVSLYISKCKKKEGESPSPWRWRESAYFLLAGTCFFYFTSCIIQIFFVPLYPET